ncbi:MAG: hypothetical protein HY909_07270 [Deltaproteobacteria bacterium]|nr:hypothetical protein [Deltaproteobacteria bacterium]
MEPLPQEFSPWSRRGVWWALAPLLLGLFVLAAWAPWCSNWDHDTLTQFHQTRAVARTGRIPFRNGPGNARDFPQLRPSWLTERNGEVLGGYPAGMAYLFALPLRLNGFAGVIRAMMLCLALSALFTYALTLRLTRDVRLAVASAYALLLGSSLAGWSTMCAPFVPTATFGVLSVYLAVRACDFASRGRALGYLLGAGLFASFAFSCHMLWFLGAGLLGALLVLRRPVAHALGDGAAYALGMVPMVALMAWTNHDRWGTWSPISFGTSDFAAVSNTGTVQALPTGAVGAAETIFKPMAPFVLAWVLGMYLARRSARAVGLLAAVGIVGALIPESELRNQTLTASRIAFAYLVDMSRLSTPLTRIHEGGMTLGSWFMPHPHHNLGPVVTRSLVQCSPLLALGLVALLSPATAPDDGVRARQRWMLAVSVLGVLGSVLLRAHLPEDHALGMSSHNFRYLSPALPVLFALAFAELRGASLKPWQLALWALLGASLGQWLLREPNDADLLRRKLTLWAPLALSFALVSAVKGAQRARGWEETILRHAAAALVALCLGWGTAITVGVDGVFMFRLRRIQDESTQAVRRCVRDPKFVFVGGWSLDEGITVMDRQDVVFINLGMDTSAAGLENSRRLILEAEAPDRPAYLVQDDPTGPWHLPSQGLETRPIANCPRVFRLVRR